MTTQLNRNLVVASYVLLFHVAMLWALQSGLLMRAVELVVPVQLLSEFIEPPAPRVTPPPPVPQPPVTLRVVTPKTLSLPPPPQTLAIVDNTPAPDARLVEASPVAPLAPITLAVAPAPPAPAPPATASVQLPSSDADYLQNPRPTYPPVSKRLGEQGLVVHSVLIGVDGLPVSAKLVTSSGFARLDQAAFVAVMRWRYTPGKRNGEPAAMSFNVPINLVLE